MYVVWNPKLQAYAVGDTRVQTRLTRSWIQSEHHCASFRLPYVVARGRGW